MNFNEGYHIDHWGNLISSVYVDLRQPAERSPIALLVKGCRREHAIEDSRDVKISNPKIFRDQGENLIRDPGEGYFSESRVLHDAVNDPNDIERQSQRIQAHNRTAELTESGRRSQLTGTRSRREESTSLEYAPKGWLFCASIAPTTPEEWRAWQSTLDPAYDHVSHVYRPREFARALAGMTAAQIGPQGPVIPTTSSLRGFPSQRTHHPSQLIFHGPVVYVDDVFSWLYQARTADEFFLRAVFTKATSHQAQREYRFVVASETAPDHDCRLLRASPGLVDAMTRGSNSPDAPAIPFMDSAGDVSGQSDNMEPNPLGGIKLWSDLASAMQEQAQQPDTIVRSSQPDPDSLPDDFHTLTATYAGVTALRYKLDSFHKWAGTNTNVRNAATAAAWFAEQDIRTLCEKFDDPIAGISITNDGFIVVHIAIGQRPNLDCRLAVAPSGEPSLMMKEGDRAWSLVLEDPFHRTDLGKEVEDFIESA